MQIDGLESRSLAEQIADRLEQTIISNRLKPGDQLPNEQELVAQLGVGRGTVREAVKILESCNVVEIRRGRGTFVCKYVGQVGDPLGFRFAPDKRRLALDLSELRLMLEPQIAALSARNASEPEIEELVKLCRQVEQRILEGRDYGREDIEFHVKIACMTGNTVIPQIVPLIAQGVTLYVDLTQHMRAGTAARMHQEVVDAIRAHDEKAAADAMRRHLEENQQSLKELEI